MGRAVQLACRRTSASSSPGWRRTIRRGSTRGFRCLEEPGASREPLDDRAHPSARRYSAQSAAPDDVAPVSAGALAGTRRGRFLHDRSLDRARIGDELRGVPARRTDVADSRDRLHAVAEAKPSILNGATTDCPRSSPAASRRDPQLLLSVGCIVLARFSRGT